MHEPSLNLHIVRAANLAQAPAELIGQSRLNRCEAGLLDQLNPAQQRIIIQGKAITLHRQIHMLEGREAGRSRSRALLHHPTNMLEAQEQECPRMLLHHPVSTEGVHGCHTMRAHRPASTEQAHEQDHNKATTIVARNRTMGKAHQVMLPALFRRTQRGQEAAVSAVAKYSLLRLQMMDMLRRGHGMLGRVRVETGLLHLTVGSSWL